MAALLRQIIYTSRSFGFDTATLAGILLDARRCNLRDDITGSLVCRQDIYLQLLEGPPALVEACFERIGRDDRHVDIRVLSRSDTPDRLFPGWAMRDDPAQSWMWSAEDVAAGAAERATAEEARAIFARLAAIPDDSSPAGCPVSGA